MTADNKPLVQSGWLRALVYIILSLALVYGTGDLVTRLFGATGRDPGDQDVAVPVMIASYTVMAIVFITMALLFRAFIDKQSIVSMGFQWNGYRSHAAAGFFLGILLLAMGSLVLVLLEFVFFTGVEMNAAQLLYSLPLFIIVAFTEEIAFRGYILNNLLQSTNKWVALLVSSILFALFHVFNNNISTLALLNIFVAGFLLGINYIFTRNLWFAILLHFSWNYFQGPVLGYEVSGMNTQGLLQQTIKGPDLLTGGEFGFEGSLICFLLNVITCVLLASYYAGYRTRSLPEFKH